MKNLVKTHQSLIYALAIFLLLSLWLASGYLAPEQQASAQPVNNSARSLVPKVRVRTPELKRVSQEIVINGRTEPARAVTLRAEVEGRVVALGAVEGSVVRKGDLIVELIVPKPKGPSYARFDKLGFTGVTLEEENIGVRSRVVQPRGHRPASQTRYKRP